MGRSLLFVLVVGCLALSSVVGATGLHGGATAGFETDRVALQPGGQTQVAVVVGEADDGVGGYEIAVSSADTTVVEITDVTVAGRPNTTNATITADGSRVEVSTSGLGNDGPEFQIFTLTLVGVSPGNASLDLSAPFIAASDGQPYVASVPDGTADVFVTESGETLSPTTSESQSTTDVATSDQADGGQPVLMGVWLVGAALLVLIVAFLGYQHLFESKEN